MKDVIYEKASQGLEFPAFELSICIYIIDVYVRTYMFKIFYMGIDLKVSAETKGPTALLISNGLNSFINCC